MHLFSKKADKKMAAYQKELIETHYQEVDNMYRQMRGWRHDYRNHIQTMKAYAATEDRIFSLPRTLSVITNADSKSSSGYTHITLRQGRPSRPPLPNS